MSREAKLPNSSAVDAKGQHLPEVVVKSPVPPLSGTKTRALSPIAIETLRSLSRTPAPCQSLNPGLCNRLAREGLVDEVQLPSPYASHKGRDIAHFKASTAGMSRLTQLSIPSEAKRRQDSRAEALKGTKNEP